MGLTMKERHRLTDEIAARYRGAPRARKTAILEEFIATCGYNRKYAIHLLNHWGKSHLVQLDGELVNLKGGRPRPRQRVGRVRYPRSLDADLEKLWVLHNRVAGKRLAAAIREHQELLRRSLPRLAITPEAFDDLVGMSAATIDRRLAKVRRAVPLHGLGHTRPASALRHLVPVRTAFDWQDARPGAFQADTVGHEGGLAKGEYCFSLVLVDVASGWTELRALKNRAARWIVEALTAVWSDLPFPFTSLHTDNGGEFVNATVASLCAERGYGFTRSRADKKNDNCYVESRNDDAVRRTVGSVRLDTDAELSALAEFYQLACPLSNFFLPSHRLISKHRDGGRLHKCYDTPTTPYRRLLDSPHLAQDAKDRLTTRYHSLDLVDLKLRYDAALDKLTALVKAKTRTAVAAATARSG